MGSVGHGLADLFRVGGGGDRLPFVGQQDGQGAEVVGGQAWVVRVQESGAGEVGDAVRQVLRRRVRREIVRGRRRLQALLGVEGEGGGVVGGADDRRALCREMVSRSTRC
ncbi:hypothetical protein GCM10010317_048820 [Streptomyces mirabilis]|nr:hypothetical protein GCM10010317_048820 [Streptomyces mirabilis]